MNHPRAGIASFLSGWEDYHMITLRTNTLPVALPEEMHTLITAHPEVTFTWRDHEVVLSGEGHAVVRALLAGWDSERSEVETIMRHLIMSRYEAQVTLAATEWRDMAR